MQVNLYDAKARLSSLVERAAAGEEIVIAKAGRPLARLVPLDAPRAGRRRLGGWEALVRVGPDFDAPLPAELAEAFGAVAAAADGGGPAGGSAAAGGPAAPGGPAAAGGDGRP